MVTDCDNCSEVIVLYVVTSSNCISWSASMMKTKYLDIVSRLHRHLKLFLPKVPMRNQTDDHSDLGCIHANDCINTRC